MIKRLFYELLPKYFGRFSNLMGTKYFKKYFSKWIV